MARINNLSSKASATILSILISSALMFILMMSSGCFFAQQTIDNTTKNTTNPPSDPELNKTIIEEPQAVPPLQDFTIVIIPDSQKMVRYNQSMFATEADWIVQNKDARNIVAVIHVGDAVDNPSNVSQWNTVNASMSKILDAGIPLVLGLGNHDHPTATHDKFFPRSRLAQYRWFGDSYNNDSDDYYARIDVQGTKFIIMTIDMCPDAKDIQWANAVLSRYPNDHIIIGTHGFLNGKAERYVPFCNSTQYIWDNLIKSHQKARIVVSGHVHAESSRIDNNAAGLPVYQMLADYQEDALGGSGWMRILRFNPTDGILNVTTYSDYLGKYKEGPLSNLQFTYEIE